MKKIGILLLAVFVLASGTSFAAKIKYKAFTPSGAGKSLFLKSKTDQHKYFVVDKGTSFGFDIVGPTTIKIRTRAEVKAGVSMADYEMQVWEGDNLVKGRKVKAKPSLLTAEGQKSGVGVVRTMIVKVPKGKHSYRLWMTSSNTDKLYARFYQAKKAAKKSKYSSFKPYEFAKQVTLKSGKNTISYYVVDGKGGVKVSVVGPVKLQILCRSSFDKNMKGRAKFTLGMYESGSLAAQFPAVTKASGAAHFKENGDLIPSRLHTFAFDVPSGKHLYEFKMLDSASPNLALRFKISSNALGMIP